MVDSSPPHVDNVDALRRQIAELRAENERLHGLLGVGTRDEAVSPWEPTLFVEAEGDACNAPVDRNSPREAKVALFRSLFVGRDEIHACQMGELSIRQGGVESGRPGWLVECPAPRPGVSAPD